MAMNDYLKEKLKSFARDNLGVKSWKEQVDENFANGEEVALMKGFTRAAQDLFIKDLAAKAVKDTRPKIKTGNTAAAHQKQIGWKQPYICAYKRPNEYTSFNPNMMEDFKLIAANPNNIPYDKLHFSWSPRDFQRYFPKPGDFKPEEYEPIQSYRKMKLGEFKENQKALKKDPNYKIWTDEVFNPDAWEPDYKQVKAAPETMKPALARPLMAAELEKRILQMPEDAQDAWLYGQRNLENFGTLRDGTNASRPIGELNTFKMTNGKGKYSPAGDGYVYKDDHIVNIPEKPEDIESWVSTVLHEGGHRTMAGKHGNDEYSVKKGLGLPIRQELIDEISNADNPKQMINDLVGDNIEARMWLEDAAGLNPNKRPGLRSRSIGWSHKENYAKEFEEEYLAKLPKDLPNREELARNAALSLETAAEVFSLLGAKDGIAWMQKNTPNTLKSFLELMKYSKNKAEEALGPNGAVPERYNVNFHPELGD